MSKFVPVEAFPPGEFLLEELEARRWTQTEFAEMIGRPYRLVNEIVLGKRAVTPETAHDFASALGTSAQLWMNLESAWQLSKVKPRARRHYECISAKVPRVCRGYTDSSAGYRQCSSK